MGGLKGPIIPRCSSYKEAYLENQFYHEEEFIQEYKKYDTKTLDELFVRDVKEPKELAGEKRLRDFENLIYNGYSFKPHKFQRGFLEEATKGLAPLLVGQEDWLSVGPTIIRQRRWEEMSKMIMAKAPRRFGKSVAVGMIVIALALLVPGITQSIFSTGRRASRNLLEICYKLLCDLGLQYRVEKFNQEELFIVDPVTGKKSSIFCYPSNSKIDILFFLITSDRYPFFRFSPFIVCAKKKATAPFKILFFSFSPLNPPPFFSFF